MKKFSVLLIGLLIGCNSIGPNLNSKTPVEVFKSDHPLMLDQGLISLSNQISENLLSEEKRAIAIIPFSDLDGKSFGGGKFVADELIDHLFLTKKFKVIERQLIDKLLDEHKLLMSAPFNSKTAKEIGLLLGVDSIATGTITVLNSSIRVRARIISVETGEVFAVAKQSILLNDDIKSLFGLRISGRWDMVSEKEKMNMYDKYIQKALQYIDETTKVRGTFESDRDEKRIVLYKAALTQIKMALSIYPKDERGLKMADQINRIIDGSSEMIWVLD